MVTTEFRSVAIEIIHVRIGRFTLAHDTASIPRLTYPLVRVIGNRRSATPHECANDVDPELGIQHVRNFGSGRKNLFFFDTPLYFCQRCLEVSDASIEDVVSDRKKMTTMNHPRVDRERTTETASGGDHIRDSGAPSAPRTRRARGSHPLRIGFAFNMKPVNRVSLSRNGNSPSHATREALPPFHPSALMGSTAHLADEYAEWDDESTISAIHRALASAGEVVRLEADHEFPLRLRDADPDIVFNVAEGRSGPNRESHVPSFCEFWGYPYTGSDPLTLGICLDKSRTKEILTAHGVSTPDFAVVEPEGTLDHRLQLPVVVKPLHEGSSKGITQSSFCETWVDVEREVHRIHDRYDEAALVERYLPGREFTVGLLGNGANTRVLPLVEIDFTTLPRDARPIYGYEAKWIWDDPDRPLEIFHCPADCDARLQSRIEEVSLRAFRVLRCRDWARIDVRLSETGQPNILEVNPLPGIIPDPAANSCLPKAARVAGLAYDAVIHSVLRAAAARYGIPVSA